MARASGTEPVKGQVTCLARSPNGSQIAAVSLFRNEVRMPYVSSLFIWTTATGENLQSWQGPNSRIRRISFSADGSALILVEDMATSTWDVATQEEVASFPHGNRPPCHPVGCFFSRSQHCRDQQPVQRSIGVVGHPVRTREASRQG